MAPGTSQSSIVNKTSQETYCCDDCPRVYSAKRALQRHIKEKHQPRTRETHMRCRICDRLFVRIHDCRRHEAEQHGVGDKGKLPCGRCGILIRPKVSHNDPKGGRCLGTSNQDNSAHWPAAQIINQLVTPRDLYFHRASNDTTLADWETHSSIFVLGSNSHDHEEMPWQNSDGTIACNYCETPFDIKDQNAFQRHRDKHLAELLSDCRCTECDIDFLHPKDLLTHQTWAREGHCGFSFPHKTECGGHHGPVRVTSECSTDLHNDRQSFRYRLLEWEQGQLRLHLRIVESLFHRYSGLNDRSATPYRSLANGMTTDSAQNQPYDSYADARTYLQSNAGSVPQTDNDWSLLDNYGAVLSQVPTGSRQVDPRRQLGDPMELDAAAGRAPSDQGYAQIGYPRDIRGQYPQDLYRYPAHSAAQGCTQNQAIADVSGLPDIYCRYPISEDQQDKAALPYVQGSAALGYDQGGRAPPTRFARRRENHVPVTSRYEEPSVIAAAAPEQGYYWVLQQGEQAHGFSQTAPKRSSGAPPVSNKRRRQKRVSSPRPVEAYCSMYPMLGDQTTAKQPPISPSIQITTDFSTITNFSTLALDTDRTKRSILLANLRTLREQGYSVRLLLLVLLQELFS